MAYTSERNTQILIELMKYHGMHNVIASPGATNVSFVASIQHDEYFNVFSCVDERSAAYIACGMAAETGESVAIVCTGATASRNYLPGLTEAYYRHLPVLAVTYSLPITWIGHNKPQQIDRTNPLNDIAKLSVHLPIVKSQEEEWICNLRANEALLELRHNISGPVHINIETGYEGTFNITKITGIKPVDRYSQFDNLPPLMGKTAIFVGAHEKWNDSLTSAVDEFCEKYNSLVICDHTSNYKGKYGVLAALISMQRVKIEGLLSFDNVIHLGDVSGSYINFDAKNIWRVSSDGKLCDTFMALRYVFEMDEETFFTKMNEFNSENVSISNWQACDAHYEELLKAMPDMPFSNIWVANHLSTRLPEEAVLHLGILNSLRSWNLFKISNSISTYSNTGGFGIDGCVSSLLGAALTKPDTIFFGVVGDLAFFYDMNVLGNRHYCSNIRLIVINNGRGQEFRNKGHRAAQFGKDTDMFIAAAGHNGCKSESLLKNYSTNLGCEYMSASSKEEFSRLVDDFTSSTKTSKPIIFEIFTDTDDESNALNAINAINNDSSTKAKDTIKNIIGEKNVGRLKRIMKG